MSGPGGGAGTATRPEAGPAGAPAAGPPPGWRHCDRLELRALPGAVPLARARSRALLAEWGMGHLRDLLDDVELVLSELLTNALEATWAAGAPDAVVVAWLHAGGAGIVVAVWDAVPGLPRQPPAAGDGDEGGRGMSVVAAVSAWHDYVPAAGGGKLARAAVSIAGP